MALQTCDAVGMDDGGPPFKRTNPTTRDIANTPVFTGEVTAARGRATLDAVGIDLEELEQRTRRAKQYALLDSIAVDIHNGEDPAEMIEFAREARKSVAAREKTLSGQ